MTSTIWLSLRTTFSEKRYFAILSGTFVGMFVLFVFIPSSAVPGVSLSQQLSIFSLGDYGVLVLLSALYALFITMQLYVMKHRVTPGGLGAVGGSGLGVLFSGVAGTAFCASCLAPFFGLLGIGFGGIIFVLTYRLYFVIGIVALMVISIYLTARKIRRICENC